MPQTYIDKPNTMGVTPYFFEKVKNLNYLLGEFITSMERIEAAKKKAVEYAGKPLGKMSQDLVPVLVEKAEQDYFNIRMLGGDLPREILFYQPEMVSNCCSSSVKSEADICFACGEHCTLIPTE